VLFLVVVDTILVENARPTVRTDARTSSTVPSTLQVLF